MRRSYFIPILLLGSVILVTGLYGLRAFRIALEHYDAQSHHFVRKAVEEVDSETLLKSLKSEQRHRCENMRLHALSAIFVGLVFIVWAFDRRSMYARLQAAEPGQAVGPLQKAKMQIRSIAFCALLLLFAVGAVVHMRQIVPEWVDHMRARSDHRKNEHVRAFLEGEGIPVERVNWGGGRGWKSWKSITLAGPEVKDISALAELPVVSLELRNTQVTDLSPLSKSTVRWLSLAGSRTSDISPLAGTRIEHLNLKATDVSDLRPLSKMPQLKSVELSREQIMDNLQVLRSLDLTVREAPGQPALRTGSEAWLREYETVDANGLEHP